MSISSYPKFGTKIGLSQAIRELIMNMSDIAFTCEISLLNHTLVLCLCLHQHVRNREFIFVFIKMVLKTWWKISLEKPTLLFKNCFIFI